jgi:hypothetical protein
MNRQELADAMIRGKNAQGVIESTSYYVHQSEYSLDTSISKPCYACALGCALIGKLNGDFHKAEIEFEAAGGFDEDSDEPAIFADLLEIPRPLAVVVELKHLNGMTVQQIAVWLKSSEGQEANHA